MKIYSIILAMALSTCAYAGRTCEEGSPSRQVYTQAISAATKVQESLDKTDNELVLLARIGQDLSKYNLKYSHVAIAYKENNSWTILHELNTCKTSESSLYIQGLGNFFLDDMHSYESIYYVPSMDLQKKLKSKIISQLDSVKSFHGAHYSMLAFPFSTKYQNSNQFILEVMASALSRDVEINTRQQAQQYLQLTGYEPTTLNVGTMTRLGARIFKANIAFDDHPFDRRMSGYIDTITVDSIFKYLQKKDKGTLVEVF